MPTNTQKNTIDKKNTGKNDFDCTVSDSTIICLIHEQLQQTNSFKTVKEQESRNLVICGTTHNVI